MKINEYIKEIEKKIPLTLSMDFDNSGYQIGPYDIELGNVLLSLNLTQECVKKAIEQNCQLIITHHPFIFSPIKKVNPNDFKGKIIDVCCKNSISVYSTHTPFDIVENGLNDYLAKLLEMTELKHMKVLGDKKLFKYQVFVPEEYKDIIVDTIAKCGGGHIGNYSDCTFSTPGYGTFKALKDSKPFIGKIGERENVKEYKIETIIEEERLHNLLNEVRKNHPYEEMAYDIFLIHQKFKEFGIGRIGKLQRKITMECLLKRLRQITGQKNFKYCGELNKEIQNIALCTGSGMEFSKNIALADVYITGDIKYHDFQYFFEKNIALIDLDHHSSEELFAECFCENFALKEINHVIHKDNYYNIF